MYQLKLTSQAQRQLDKLPDEDLGRMVTVIQQLGNNPRPPAAKELRGSIYRIRLGEWRVIYAIFDKDNVVVVGKIARRSKDTYDKMKDLF